MSAVAAIAVAACASNEPRPTEEMARAKTLVEQAEQRGAQQYAGAELEQARKKLGDADVAVNGEEYATARRLAVEAGLDAELAIAKSGSEQARRAAGEVDESVETLRREAARGSSTRQ